MSIFGSLFGGGVPNLGNVAAMPGLDMGAGLHSPIGMTASTPMMAVPQGTSMLDMLGMANDAYGMFQQPAAPMMPMPAFQPLQAGGGQFVRHHIMPGMVQGGLLGGGM